MVSCEVQKLLMDNMREQQWPLTFSMGVVILMGSASLAVDQMIGMADNLIYSAKKEGKNRLKHGVVDA